MYTDDIALWQESTIRRIIHKNQRCTHSINIFQSEINNICSYMKENGFTLSAEKNSIHCIQSPRPFTHPSNHQC